MRINPAEAPLYVSMILYALSAIFVDNIVLHTTSYFSVPESPI